MFVRHNSPLARKTPQSCVIIRWLNLMRIMCDVLSVIALLVILVGVNLTEANDFADVGISERFLQEISFNSSQATGLVSIGALALLLGATGLYLFNYYSTAARSDDVPLYDPYGSYNPSYDTRHARY